MTTTVPASVDDHHHHDHRPRRPRQSPRRWLWLAIGTVGVAGLLGLRTFTGEQSSLSIPGLSADLLTLSTSVIVESLPFVVLGIVLSIVVQAWLPDDLLMRVPAA